MSRPAKVPTRRGPAMDAKEAADYCRVKPSTLAKHRQKGTGPAFSICLGRDPRYHVDDLDAWLWGEMAGNSVEASDRRALRRANGRELGAKP